MSGAIPAAAGTDAGEHHFQACYCISAPDSARNLEPVKFMIVEIDDSAALDTMHVVVRHHIRVVASRTPEAFDDLDEADPGERQQRFIDGIERNRRKPPPDLQVHLFRSGMVSGPRQLLIDRYALWSNA
jgi:hypothetical protein